MLSSVVFDVIFFHPGVAVDIVYLFLTLVLLGLSLLSDLRTHMYRYCRHYTMLRSVLDLLRHEEATRWCSKRISP